MLSLKQLQDMPPHTSFALGKVWDSPNGVNMTNSGKELKWIAKRGEIHDWAIYIGWATQSNEYIKTQGDKIYNKEIIKKLVPCDDEALEMYRF